MSAAMPSPAAVGAAPAADRTRVLLVDDSAVYRSLVRRELAKCDDVEIVGSCGDGRSAIAAVAAQAPDVVVLDIEMPIMDGLTALPQLIAARPQVKVIMASTLTARNADISLRALQMGAAETVAKPSASKLADDAQRFLDELLRKIRALGDAARRSAQRRRPVAAGGETSAAARSTGAAPATGAFPLRPAPTRAPELIAIGSSTGGPKALMHMLAELVKSVKTPIVITQHMPATFTAILAEHIQRATKRITVEAQEGMPIQPERIYVAPGDWHMTVRREGRTATLHLDQNPPENFCRPAVDPMLRSIAASYGPAALAIILTGMGHDGAKGARALVAAGGAVIAQDQATSVVWGMPQAAARAGVCSAILPLDEIAPYVSRLAMRHAA
mgnify:CR=1 FL=1|jgi:two-component system chemotaxis response regulator CheB